MPRRRRIGPTRPAGRRESGVFSSGCLLFSQLELIGGKNHHALLVLSHKKAKCDRISPAPSFRSPEGRRICFFPASGQILRSAQDDTPFASGPKRPAVG